MCLIDDHKVGARTEELSSAAFAFDVVQAHHGVRVCRKDAFTWWQGALETRGAGGSYCHWTKVKPSFELLHPLFDKMWRAQDDEALYIAAVQKLANYQRRFNGLADADVVGDEQAHGI